MIFMCLSLGVGLNLSLGLFCSSNNFFKSLLGLTDRSKTKKNSYSSHTRQESLEGWKDGTEGVGQRIIIIFACQFSRRCGFTAQSYTLNDLYYNITFICILRCQKIQRSAILRSSFWVRPFSIHSQGVFTMTSFSD